MDPNLAIQQINLLVTQSQQQVSNSQSSIYGFPLAQPHLYHLLSTFQTQTSQHHQLQFKNFNPSLYFYFSSSSAQRNVYYQPSTSLFPLQSQLITQQQQSQCPTLLDLQLKTQTYSDLSITTSYQLRFQQNPSCSFLHTTLQSQHYLSTPSPSPSLSLSSPSESSDYPTKVQDKKSENDININDNKMDHNKLNINQRKVAILSPLPRHSCIQVIVLNQRDPSKYLARSKRLLRLQNHCTIYGVGNDMAAAVNLVYRLKCENIAIVTKITTDLKLLDEYPWNIPTIEIELSRGSLGHLLSDFRKRKIIEIFELYDPDLSGLIHKQKIEEMKLAEKFYSSEEKIEEAIQLLENRDVLTLPEFIHLCSIYVHPLLLEYHFKKGVKLLGAQVDVYEGPLPLMEDNDRDFMLNSFNDQHNYSDNADHKDE